MNKQDFQRNFHNSYFGLLISAATLSYIQANTVGITPTKWRLNVGDLIPCCSPTVLDSGKTAIVRGLVPSTTADTIHSLKLLIPWREDIDEDPLFMRPGVPTTGMIQGRYSAWYMARKPARDTPRGYCPRHHAHTIINRSLLRSLGLENGDEYFMANRVYNKIQYDWNEACTLVENGDLLGVVVSRAVALGVDGTSRYTQIYYKQLGAVGYVDGHIPYLYEATATYPLREYIRKLSGYLPEVR